MGASLKIAYIKQKQIFSVQLDPLEDKVTRLQLYITMQFFEHFYSS